ncbi:hypothetical protein [Amycolatopsis sp. H20-H5]|uniref:hypothetical protein n=1 Tax=Amycolatopsis sp. H20-H5 TaxID=3046309 RepID=UPI002DBA0A97|nr:hypothetical protein [Amycolatopsis sp. H20-H5]MEC3978881.1 hypothetical protein [Amycolatopsis sp. H20-H5]
MPTRDEIERRVQQNDTPLSAKRSAAAQQVGALAGRRAAIAEQLREVERQLGDVLTDATTVMSIDELARFTDVPAADLTRWLTARTPARGKRTKPTGNPPATHSRARPELSAARNPNAGQASPTPAHPVGARNVPDHAAPVPAPAPVPVP